MVFQTIAFTRLAYQPCFRGGAESNHASRSDRLFPTTLSTESNGATTHGPRKLGSHGRTRTYDIPLNRRTLLPTELRGNKTRHSNDLTLFGLTVW